MFKEEFHLAGEAAHQCGRCRIATRIWSASKKPHDYSFATSSSPQWRRPKPSVAMTWWPTSRSLESCLRNPPAVGPHQPWDLAALVAAAPLEAHLVEGIDLPDDTLRIVVEIILQIGDASPLSANMTETPATFGITVGRWR